MSDLPFPDIKLQATLQSESFHCFLAFCTGSARPARLSTNVTESIKLRQFSCTNARFWFPCCSKFYYLRVINLSAIHQAIVGLLLSTMFWGFILLSNTLFYKQKKIDGAIIKHWIHLYKYRPACGINTIINDSCGSLRLDSSSHWNRKKHLGVICVHKG